MLAHRHNISVRKSQRDNRRYKHVCLARVLHSWVLYMFNMLARQKARYALMADTSPSVVRSVVISGKLSKIDP